MFDAGHLIDKLSMAEDPVERDVRPDVGAGAGEPGLEFADLHDLHQGTGPGVALAEEEEVEGFGLRQDDEIGLNIAGGQTSGYAVVFTVSDELPDVRRGFGQSSGYHASLYI